MRTNSRPHEHHGMAEVAQGVRIPTLAVGREMSGLAPTMAEMMREVAEHVEALTVPESGHWIPEEQPTLFADVLLGFALGQDIAVKVSRKE